MCGQLVVRGTKDVAPASVWPTAMGVLSPTGPADYPPESKPCVSTISFTNQRLSVRDASESLVSGLRGRENANVRCCFLCPGSICDCMRE